jgi:hypothetical protein
MPVGRIPQSYIQKCKIGLHFLQALFIFVAGCLTIAVMTRGEIGGASKYYFAMVSAGLPKLFCLQLGGKAPIYRLERGSG